MTEEQGSPATAPRPAAAAGPDPQRILVRLPNWVGDVVMTTPALRALRSRWPRAHVVVEGRPFLRRLLEGLDSVDEFLPDASRGVGPTLERARELRRRGLDLAILLPDSPRSALGPFLARIPRRVGYSRDPLRRLCLTTALSPPADANGKRIPVPMPERYLGLTRALGCPDGGRTELAVDDASRARLHELLAAAGAPTPGAPSAHSAGLLVGAPGANFGSSKLYPPQQFAEACDGIHRQHGLHTVLAPAPGGECELARDVAARMTTPVSVLDDPPTDLAELKALIADAALVLSNDTGPRSMAVALDVPVVVTMGPTDPRHTHFQLERQRVLRMDDHLDCSPHHYPCHLKTCPIDHRCMTRLEPARVVAAAGELLA